MTSIPQQSIVLIEDIDTAFIHGLDGKTSSSSSAVDTSSSNNLPRKETVTYSGLLNILDGVASAWGIIFIVSTNHIEKLGSSLIRPGRIDLMEHVSYVNELDIADYFDSFFPETEDMAKSFAKALISQYEKVTMAELQNFLIKHRSSASGALQDIQNFRMLVPTNSF
jgi:chaperone BCS1